MTKTRKTKGTAVPTKAEILRFIESSEDKVTKRDVARAFSVKGSDRIALKKQLRELVEEGALERDAAKALRPAGHLPSVLVVEVSATDAFGDILLRPLQWKGDAPPPKIYLTDRSGKGKSAALGKGDRALVRLKQNPDEVTYSATVIKALEGVSRQVLGVYYGGEHGGRVESIEKKARNALLIEEGHHKNARDGELVLAELLPRRQHRVHGLKPARVIACYGDVSETKQISLIAIHQYDIPHKFSADTLDEAKSAQPASIKGREDLRSLPLITIDPRDARDHDDAVFAEPDTDPGNPGGWHLIVAIADVAYYVRAGSALDRDARIRGNSVYFPDRVVPMLPEELSTDLCSLKPGEDRACLAVHIWIDAQGQKRKHKFVRALMRSQANIAYEDVQSAIEGAPTVQADALLEPVLKPLYGAHDALSRGREKRGPLRIQSEEKKILLNENGEVADIVTRTALRAHRVIEDFMVMANVCAAETLEDRRIACMYRVHEDPPLDKVEALRDFLDSLDYRLARAQTISPTLFNKVLDRFEGTEHQTLINQVILRTQTQAYYSPDNKGHFGLALERYAHFTSPIRRYADLLVHRGLIRALGLGDDGLADADIETFHSVGEAISQTERRAMAAERDSTDRYLASFLSARIDQHFEGRIAGVTRFGLFISLIPSGADGFVPISSLGSDYYRFEEHRHALIGQRHHHIYQLGDEVDVRLVEARPISGGIRLEIVGEPARQATSGPKTKKQGKTGAPRKGKKGNRGKHKKQRP